MDVMYNPSGLVCHVQVTRGEEQSLNASRYEGLLQVLQMDGVSDSVVVAKVAVLIFNLSNEMVEWQPFKWGSNPPGS